MQVGRGFRPASLNLVAIWWQTPPERKGPSTRAEASRSVFPESALKASGQAPGAVSRQARTEPARKRPYERVQTQLVPPGTGDPTTPYEFELTEVVGAAEGPRHPQHRPRGTGFQDPETTTVGGWRPERKPYFKKFSTRTMRPVVDFDTCIKCTLCWLQCPDSCFDVTPEGYYDANMAACCGCGVCEAVCPVEHCVTMVNEAAFTDNASQWEAWKANKETYKASGI